MPQRFTNAQRLRITLALIDRDGGYVCRTCGQGPARGRALDIDHIDGNKGNNALANLRLACRSCNMRHLRALQRESAIGRSIHNVEGAWRSRSKSALPESGSPREAVRLLRSQALHGGPSIEIALSHLCKQYFEPWVIDRASRPGGVLKNDAITGGMYYTDCSEEPIKRVLKALTSFLGPLEEVEVSGSIYIVLRSGVGGASGVGE